jgi:hypothetical protein
MGSHTVNIFYLITLGTIYLIPQIFKSEAAPNCSNYKICEIRRIFEDSADAEAVGRGSAGLSI